MSPEDYGKIRVQRWQQIKLRKNNAQWQHNLYADQKWHPLLKRPWEKHQKGAKNLILSHNTAEEVNSNELQ